MAEQELELLLLRYSKFAKGRATTAYIRRLNNDYNQR